MRVKYEVEQVDLPEFDELKARIEQGGLKGWTLVSVSETWGSGWVLVWLKPGREQRG